MTSEVNGLNTTSRKVTSESRSILTQLRTTVVRSRTFVPKKPIPIPYFPFSCFGDIKNADAQPNIMKDAVRVFSVQFRGEGLLDGRSKVGWMNGYFVLALSMSATKGSGWRSAKVP